MPIPFTVIPRQLRLSIIQKQDVSDFAKFSISSTKAYDLSLQVRSRFSRVVKQETKLKSTKNGTHYFQYVDISSKTDSNRKIFLRNLGDVPIRVLFGKVVIRKLTGSSCKFLSNFLSATGSFIKRLTIEYVCCSSGELNTLLEIARILEFSVLYDISSSDFLKIPALQKLDYFGLCQIPVTDSEFLALKMKEIKLCSALTSESAVNSFLKEWINGDRIIKSLEISLDDGAQETNIFEDIPFTTTSIKKEKHYRIRNKENGLIDILIRTHTYTDGDPDQYRSLSIRRLA